MFQNQLLKFVLPLLTAVGLLASPAAAQTLFHGMSLSSTQLWGVASADFNGDGKMDIVASAGQNGSTIVNLFLNNGDGSFAASVPLTVGTTPRVVLAADFNNDGNADIAVTNQGSANVSVLLGDGAGNFSAAVNFAVGTNPISLTASDFNNDGNMDMAVANYNSANVSLMLGNGAGGFVVSTIAVGGGPRWITSADFNSDGNPDMAIADSIAGTANVLLGDGLGGFAAPVSFAAGTAPFGIVTDDFNHDGNADMAVSNQASNTVSVFLGDGAGSFATAISLAAGAAPFAIVNSDFNNDGNADICVANNNSTNVSVFLGDGIGGFAAAQNSNTGTGLFSMASADFNGDGNSDIAVGAWSAGLVMIMNGDGAGGFGQNSRFTTGMITNNSATADFNKDGKADAVVIHSNNNMASVMLGDGAGSLGAPVSFATGTSPLSVVTDDFNGDGNPDFAVANVNSSNIGVYLGDGLGGFAAAINSASTNPAVLATGDFNRDGVKDIAVSHQALNSVEIMLGNGTGSFVSQGSYAVGTSPRSVISIDLNGDGNLDLATPNANSNNISVLLGNGNGTFTAATNFATGTGPFGVTGGDFNGDGLMDLATNNFTSGDVSVLLGNGAGAFTLASTYAAGFQSQSITNADLNADGVLDLIVTSNMYLSVLIGDGLGGFAAAQDYSANDGQINMVSIADFNGDGLPDLLANNRAGGVTVMLNFTDITAPSGSVAIAGGIALTNIANTTLDITCTDNVFGSGCSQMMFSPDGVTTGAWVPFAATFPWTLGEGLNTVYVSFMDVAGNTSGFVSDSIILDTLPPAAPAITSPVTDTYVQSAVRPAISGTAETGASVSLYDSAALLGATPATGGNWTLAGGPALTEGVHSFYATATDPAGNTGGASTTIRYIVDVTAPVITLTGPADVYVEAGSGVYVDAGATSTDAIDGPAAVSAVGSVNTAVIGTYTLTYDRTDTAGNAAIQVVRRVHVRDTTAPVITGTPLADVYAEATGVNTNLSLTSPVATDLFTVTVTSNAPVSFPVGTTVVTWTATDASGNFATATQNVIVRDTTAPVIGGTPLADINAEATGITTNVSLTAPVATDLFNVTVTNNAPASFPLGTTVVTWTATDAHGNVATATQNVVVSDTTAPVITRLGSDPYVMVAGQSYVDAGATASDLATGDLTASIVTVNPLAGGPAGDGVYTVTYNVSDVYGNAATQVTRSVRVAAAGATNNGSTVSLALTGSTTVDIYSAGEVVFSPSASAANGSVPASTDFPFGAIDYYTTVSTVGGSQTVRLTFSSALPANILIYKVDASGSYTELPNTLWTRIDANTVEVTLTDGDALTDLDGTADGVIHDPLAIGTPATPAAGGGGCSLAQASGGFDPTMVLMLVLAAVSLQRRKRG